jgi:hypothetical protein
MIYMDNQNQNNIYHFILIHIGNDLPSHINSCIHQIRLFNSPESGSIWVLANQNELEKIENLSNLTKIALDNIPLSWNHLYFRKNYTNDSLNNFWKYTIERFYYLEQIMRIYNLQNVFHLEYDNMLYVNLKDYFPVFLANYKGLGVTLDCDYRVIPGFMFIRDCKPLELFNQYVAETIKQNKNDMQLLADFKSFIENDEVIQTLPVLMPEYDKPLKNSDGYESSHPKLYINHFESFQGIFDAAAIGQYLGGISPRNNPQGLNTVGFINETNIFQCSYLNFKWAIDENNLKIPLVCYSNTNSWYPIFNLHIHSKNLAQFLSDQSIHEGCKTTAIEVETIDYFKYVQKNESIQPNVQSNLKLDILIPVVEKDLEILPLTIDSVRKNLRHPIGRIIVIAPDSEKIKAVCTSKGCEFLVEDTALSITKKEIQHKCDFEDVNRFGWLFQQLIKLSGDTICTEEHYLTIDADTVLLRPQVFELKGKIVLLHSDEHHQPYFDLYEKLFGVTTKTTLSFVSHQMVFKKSFLKEFKEHIKKNGKNWLFAILKNIDFSQGAGMSEYELYGQWLLQNKADQIVREYFFNVSLGRLMYKSLEDLQARLSKFYRSVSFHHYNIDTSLDNLLYLKKPIITMSTLGSNGRFGNQIFQYAFLKIYAKKYNLNIQTSKWIGQYLFGHSDPPISRQLPQMREGINNFAESLVSKSETPFKNIDFWGWFQYYTKYYAPYKEYFRSLFTPIIEIEEKMIEASNKLRSIGKTVVGLHLRRGDYRESTWLAPVELYKEWLKFSWNNLDKPVLFIASDEPETVITNFAEYSPVMAKDLDAELPSAEFYPDFYLLSHCDILAISNSTYSFAASLLNEYCKLFLRPHFSSQKLVPFDPWESEILLGDTVSHTMKTIRDLLESKKFKEALTDIEQALKIYPDHSDLLNLLGELKLLTGKIKEAKEIFSDIIGRWPNHLQALNNLAVVMTYEMNFDMAITLLEKVLSIDSGSKEAVENLVFVRKAKFSADSSHSNK